MTALLLIDIQNDFLPGGSLPVPNGNEILPLVDQLLQRNYDLVIATKDWHPADHLSFAANHGKKAGEHVLLGGIDQVLWPVHCVQNTRGADFPKPWPVSKVFYKGTDPEIDSYSAFFDNGHRRSTGLGEYLKAQGIRELYAAGLATDYCVKYSVLDALKLGFKVHLLLDACRGIDLKQGDVQKAVEEMREAGALVTTVFQSLRRA